jgi:hypothetical protein
MRAYRKDIADLLKAGKLDYAIIRVESVIREQLTLTGVFTRRQPSEEGGGCFQPRGWGGGEVSHAISMGKVSDQGAADTDRHESQRSPGSGGGGATEWHNRFQPDSWAVPPSGWSW